MRFFEECGNTAIRREFDGAVFFYCIEAADVINAEHRRIFLPAKGAELLQALAEKVVPRDDNEIVVHILRGNYQVEVADGAEFVRVVGRFVVDDGEIKL